MSVVEIPIFPLKTVLFPGGPLPLRIFEPRYTDMISQCMKTNTGFGVCLIQNGNEAGSAAEFHAVGTLAKVVDFHLQRDGILGIVVQGDARFHVRNFQIAKDQLITAEVEYFNDEPKVPVPDEFQELIKILEAGVPGFPSVPRVNSPGREKPLAESPEIREDASWLGFRLVEMLPLRLSQKQYFLQLNEPLLRLERIDDVIHQLGAEN